ncbi:hypothetical protein FNV43_RR03437 [Rhamnella rubrinervis]|uniref:Pentatricopeptide repeat-containing protein n=1 Tax=Rhamnella rubrinervis TaxID=2594499 RepID=A0A8K0MP31_9ROSA|nr:hypothetical protein FNV43_RR03437 [Rhamnella rubrinervis]
MVSLSMSCVPLMHLSSPTRSISNRRHVSKTSINLSVLETPCRDFKKFKQILSQMIVTGFIKDIFAAKRLLQFSTHDDLPFFNLDYSYKIFNTIENPDASIYNIMIMVYVRRGYPHRAIHLYKLMLYRNVYPNVYTYPFLVEACAIRKSQFEGASHVLKLGFYSDVDVRSTFIDMYADCHDLKLANEVFREGPMMDSFVWYSLLEAETMGGDLDKAEYHYNMMPEKDMIASNLMIVSFWKGYTFQKADHLVNEIPKNDTVSWSALIYCFQAKYREMYEEAFDLFIRMHANGIRIDELVVEAVLRCCIKFVYLGDIEMMGKLIHSLVVKIGIECDVKLQNSLICLYSKCGEILSAQNLFTETCWLDQSSWYYMLHGYVGYRLHKNVKALVESMPEKDVDSCRLMISYYSERECFTKSLALFKKMVSFGVSLDEDTWSQIIMDLPYRFHALDLGKCMHAYLIKNGYDLKHVHGDVPDALSYMYGMPPDERGTFDSVDTTELKDVVKLD